MRIALFSERLRPPFDEGFKNTAIHLARALRSHGPLLALTAFGEDIPGEDVRNLPANRLLLSREIGAALRSFAPDVLLYVPTASATPAAMLRTSVLRRYAPRARLAMIALQPRAYGRAGRLLIRLLRPPLTLVQSTAMAQMLAGLGCRVARIGSGVDAERFAPATPEQRVELRRRLGLAKDAFVVLHTGHINEGRNVQALAALQQAGCQAILIGSSSTEQDARLAAGLQAAGVLVVRDYVEHIEDYYRAADCYVFPVICDTGAIAVPLSVLEAMACDLPVVAMPYGDLPVLFAAGDGLRFAADADDLVAGALATRGRGPANTRRLVLPHSWSAVAGQILSHVMEENV